MTDSRGHKRSITLPPRQREILEREAERLGVSVAETLRRALDAYFEMVGLVPPPVRHKPAQAESRS